MITPFSHSKTAIFTVFPTPIGFALLASERGDAVQDARLGSAVQPLIDSLYRDYPTVQFSQAANTLDALASQFIQYMKGTASAPPLELSGTDFQKTVWQVLQHIPRGQTLTYKALAERIGKPTAFRAVANACGANRLAVLVPCHRVIATNGALAGFRWGIEQKQALLDWEKPRR